MKVLVIGSGGREHALVWKVSQSPRVKKVYCAPGNDGMADLATCVPLSSEDVPALLQFALREKIDLTIVGPEVPLSLGLVDVFEEKGLRVFGPRKGAAMVESSKCFMKQLCERHHIPTAPFAIFTDVAEARKAIESRKKFPVVIKTDGLASGKGVIIAQTAREAIKTVEEMMLYEKFGEAGRQIILEEFMPGIEATYMVATDGVSFIPLDSAQDHKRIFDNDEGPNTGGMGAYSPAPIVTEALAQKVNEQIIEPALRGLAAEGKPYRGILYAGLMISNGEPRLVEFNCRFGDPEAQAILFRMESDLMDLVEAVLAEKAGSFPIHFSEDPAVCVVMSAKGYPAKYDKGQVISGLSKTAKLEDTFVFHAGTRKEGENFVTCGGRVLGVTARGKTLGKAIEKVYKAVKLIDWKGAHYRKDIGAKAL